MISIIISVVVCRTLRKWWAQYMESTSEMNTALQFYESAQDVLSLVRVYCYCAQIEKVLLFTLLRHESCVSHYFIFKSLLPPSFSVCLHLEMM